MSAFVSEKKITRSINKLQRDLSKQELRNETCTITKFLMSLSNAMLLKVAKAQLSSKVNEEAAWSNGFSGM